MRASWCLPVFAELQRRCDTLIRFIERENAELRGKKLEPAEGDEDLGDEDEGEGAAGAGSSTKVTTAVPSGAVVCVVVCACCVLLLRVACACVCACARCVFDRRCLTRLHV